MAGFSKREVLLAPLAAALGLPAVARAKGSGEVSGVGDLALDAIPGPFNSSIASLETYRTPDWFRDAKFGIWSHWGPQAVPGQGDWYARYLYAPGHPHYDHHVKTYGHPSKFGYKDIIPLWKAERFDPDALMARYAAAGAKYFVSMGVHHDNFDLWNSRHHRWNAAAMGPKRDIVGAWKAAAKRQGLRFGVSEHLGASYCWWYPNHLFDQFWGKMDADYDGADPRYADLYHDNRDEPYRGHADTWYTKNPKFHRRWFDRIRDLVDSYQPDLLYSDGGIPFGEVGRTMVAHLYNSSVARSGRLEAVYAHKQGPGEFLPKAGVQDVERGALEGINPLPWQTDTSNGDWFFNQNDRFKTTEQVIGMLADIVSKNGNLLLNVVQYRPRSDRQVQAGRAVECIFDGRSHDGCGAALCREWRNRNHDRLFGQGRCDRKMVRHAAPGKADGRVRAADQRILSLLESAQHLVPGQAGDRYRQLLRGAGTQHGENAGNVREHACQEPRDHDQ